MGINRALMAALATDPYEADSLNKGCSTNNCWGDVCCSGGNVCILSKCQAPPVTPWEQFKDIKKRGWYQRLTRSEQAKVDQYNKDLMKMHEDLKKKEVDNRLSKLQIEIMKGELELNKKELSRC